MEYISCGAQPVVARRTVFCELLRQKALAHCCLIRRALCKSGCFQMQQRLTRPYRSIHWLLAAWKEQSSTMSRERPHRDVRFALVPVCRNLSHRRVDDRESVALRRSARFTHQHQQRVHFRVKDTMTENYAWSRAIAQELECNAGFSLRWIDSRHLD